MIASDKYLLDYTLQDEDIVGGRTQAYMHISFSNSCGGCII